MKTYDVTIQATFTETYSVEAETKDEAEAEAYERFSVFDSKFQNYEDEILDKVEVTP